MSHLFSTVKWRFTLRFAFTPQIKTSSATVLNGCMTSPAVSNPSVNCKTVFFYPSHSTLPRKGVNNLTCTYHFPTNAVMLFVSYYLLVLYFMNDVKYE